MLHDAMMNNVQAQWHGLTQDSSQRSLGKLWNPAKSEIRFEGWWEVKEGTVGYFAFVGGNFNTVR